MYVLFSRYAEFVASILILQGGSESLGVGGGGEHMLMQDVQLIRQEMIGTKASCCK